MQGAQNLTREVYLQARRNDDGEVQRSRWTFYETINVEIEIKDKTGKIVTDAQVLANYYMPPMSYKTEAKMKKGKYYATMKFIMAGSWYIAVIIHRDGKTSATKINVDTQ